MNTEIKDIIKENKTDTSKKKSSRYEWIANAILLIIMVLGLFGILAYFLIIGYDVKANAKEMNENNNIIEVTPEEIEVVEPKPIISSLIEPPEVPVIVVEDYFIEDNPNFYLKDLYKDFIVVENSTLIDSVYSVQEQLSRLYSETVFDILREEWKICIVDEIPMQEDLSSNEVSGCANSDEKRIYIVNNPMTIEWGLLHEVGHAVDSACECVSLTTEFAKIYDSEKDSFRYSHSVEDGYEQSNPTEFFACVFDELCVNTTNAFNTAPKTSEYISKLLGMEIIDVDTETNE